MVRKKEEFLIPLFLFEFFYYFCGMIRYIEKKTGQYYIQKKINFLLFDKWISLRSGKTFFHYWIFNVIGQVIVAFFWAWINRLFNGEITGLEMLTSPGYLFGAITWPILIALYFSRKVIFDYIDSFEIENCVKTRKRTIFGKIKTVYYEDNKSLRKEKLEKLKSLF